MDFRLVELERWLGAQFPSERCTLAPASDDASFRRYLRARVSDGRSFVVMDAPPDKEDCRPFVRVARLFAAAGAHVPAIHAQDLDAGFLLLEDLGEATFLDCLERGDDPQPLYAAAADTLRAHPEARAGPACCPDYDRALLARELALFPDWYLARELRRELAPPEREALRTAFDALLANNLAQPRVFVHRDYHSRNLMRERTAARASSTSRTRSTARSPTTWSRCCATPTSLGRGAGARLGGALLGKGAQGRPAGARGLRAISTATSSGWARSAS